MSYGKGNEAEVTVQDEFTASLKGVYMGNCNRSACFRPGADWYNHGTSKYYCQSCAFMLNDDPFNKRDAMAMYGHDLCTKGEQ